MRGGSAPNAQQKRWMGEVASLGSIVSGGEAIVHHCVGTTARHQKVRIGHAWIIPLTPDEHNALHHDGETFGFDSRKDFEKHSFLRVCKLTPSDKYINDEIKKSIMEYHL